MKNNRKMIAGLVVACGLVLGACSSNSSDDTAAPDTTAAVETDDSAAPSVTVVIDEEVKAQLDVESGSAIIPGSIESVAQDLSEECTAAVAPLRELMKEYPSLRQVPPDGTYEKAFEEGKKCEAIDAQQWADFYTLELAGWIYAATDNK